METIRIRVNDVVFRSEDFHILSATSVVEGDEDSFESVSGKKVTCKGSLWGIREITSGVTLEVQGKWVFNKKYGKQLEIRGWKPWASTSSEVRTFLRYCIGVLGESDLQALVDAFGLDTFRVLEEEPEKLSSVPGFDDGLITLLLGAWSESRSSSDLSGFFSLHSISAEQMKAVLNVFGAASKKVIEENPYCLLEIPGFHFAKVDEIAQGFGIEPEDPKRYSGAILWALRESSLSGHLYLRRGEIAPYLRELIRVTSVSPFDDYGMAAKIAKGVEDLEREGKVVVDPQLGAYLPNLFKYERDSSRVLARLISSVQLDIDTKEFLDTYEVTHQIKLSEAQREAVEKLAKNKVLVLTGLPGTGKSVCVRAFVELFKKAGISFSLMAPTGIAAKRLASVTGNPAATIHRSLHYTGEAWGYNSDNKYSVGAVVVDESSMVDQELFYRLLDALEDGTFLVLIGDDAQLPSVGPGNVLRELISCKDIPTVRLTQIFRQAQESDIIMNSHRINNGEPIVVGGVDSDFRFVPLVNELKIVELITQMAVKLKERDANFQVLAPKYDGLVGVTNLNNRLREVLNPPSVGKKELEIGELKFREGDRVMVVKNDYHLGVYNGDMGKLMSLDKSCVRVRIHGIGEDGLDVLKDIPRKEVASKLRLAYAITIHKSQGSEFDTVITPMVRTQGRMLQRNLLYTAVTRAKKKVWLLGDFSSVQSAIDNNKVVMRNTGLGKATSEEVLALSGVKENEEANGSEKSSGDLQ